MKTLGIIFGILGITALLGWIVAQTLSSNNEDSAYNMHPSNFEKPNTENNVSITDSDEDKNELPDLNDLLDDEQS